MARRARYYDDVARRKTIGTHHYNRGNTVMKTQMSKVALACALAMLSLSGAASADGTPWPHGHGQCTNAMLRGSYAFTISGQNFLPNGTVIQHQGIAMTKYDGMGGATQVDMVLLSPNAPVPPGTPPTDPVTGFHDQETGTYSVNPDCTGRFTITGPSATNPVTGATIPGAHIEGMFVLSDHGERIHSIVTLSKPPGAPGPIPALIQAEGYKVH
jgi:hypothetical protein